MMNDGWLMMKFGVLKLEFISYNTLIEVEIMNRLWLTDHNFGNLTMQIMIIPCSLVITVITVIT